MPDTVLVAVIVGGVSSTVAPLLLSALNSRNRRKEKAEDYERLDKVARQAAEAAELLVERQDAAAGKAAEAARLLAINTAEVAETAKESKKTLDTIHGLVNSNLTASMQGEYGSAVREAAALQELIELKKAAGSEPTVEALAALKSARDRIAELGLILSDRRT
jgi:DNA anti-recombination protein RmuC